MKTVALVLTVWGFLFVFPFPVTADPQLEVNVEPSASIRAGEICRLTLELKWTSDEGDYFFIQPNLELENLTLEETGEANETFDENGQERKRKTFLYKLRAGQAGNGRIRPFRIGYTQPTQGQARYLETQELEIRILHDRRFLLQILLTLFGLAVLAGSAVGLAGWSRSRSKLKKEHPLEPSLEERYLKNFPLVSQKLPEAGKLFRCYLTEKYQLGHLGNTNLDIFGQLEEKMRPDELNVLRKIFDRLDEYRFGNPSRSQTEQQQLYRDMIRFVEGKKII